MMTPEELAAIKARVERPMEDTWPLRADIRALVAEVERLTAENERLENWRDESGASFMDLREALKKAGTDPYRTAHGGTDRVRVAIACVARLAAEVERLQRIEAAAYAYREDGYLGTDGMRHHTPEAYADFDAALRAAGSGE